jgi:hypothetical protein
MRSVVGQPILAAAGFQLASGVSTFSNSAKTAGSAGGLAAGVLQPGAARPWSFYIFSGCGSADELFFGNFDLEFFQEFGVVGHFLA